MTDASVDLVRYSLDDQVAVLHIDDGKANALSHQMIGAINAQLDQAEANSARAVVMVGRPGRFCAGFDLETMRAGPSEARDLLRVGAELALRLYLFPAPVVLAVTGHALAMGAILLMASDVRVGAAGDFKIGLNEVRIGMPVPRFATELADDRLSRRHLDHAVNLAGIYDPAIAVDVGYLDVVVDPTDVERVAMERAGELAPALFAEPFAMTRQNRRGATAERIEAGLSSDVEMFAIAEA
jgi:enoyl-CoA hydratase